ncbi:hypothetical protein HMPREF1076_04873 [Parabacteroides goldsteinii CL02T12C30]|uniref:Uncharacterized protein n=1 Tax=Parabacteroides goldsteinii CL02T12C30 TaxID=999418 RepID=K5ZX11_9BACT|nr:hypothetical protein HMPREF1076_04873 [Parabacteroides goldsteinii CL02T12C30]
MELTYFYKAEMPNCQDWTLDISGKSTQTIPLNSQQFAPC